MKQIGSFRENEHSRRRSRQSFRSQELLTSLTLSAEAITLRNESGDPDEAAARASRHTRRRSTPKDQSKDPQQGVVNVSNAKLLLKKFNSAHKYRLGVDDSLREEDADEALEGFSLKLKRRSLIPINPAILPGQILPTPIPQHPTKYQDKHAIGSFETVDSKWKATIEGEVEKFMYPSLRLEALYEELIPDPVDDPDEKPMPSPKTIDNMLTSTSKVSWEVEHVAPSPVHVVHAQQVDSKRLQFDQKLQDAEGILRKREATSLRITTTPTVAAKVSCLDGLKAVKELPLKTETTQQQPIPRLPQTRKYVFYVPDSRTSSQ
ncbi:hypothetical protein DVH05_014959 [Phytophthora capsici]|nr:hypothetical protein DVH05_014959 [Phytophthora capsici]|eukprot:jgi/Phyca11/111812/e_gw1.21.301.1